MVCFWWVQQNFPFAFHLENAAELLIQYQISSCFLVPTVWLDIQTSPLEGADRCQGSRRACQRTQRQLGSPPHFLLSLRVCSQRGCWEINLDLQLPLHLPLLRVGRFPWEREPGYHQDERVEKRAPSVCLSLRLSGLVI